MSREMQLAVISFTETGKECSTRLTGALNEQGYTCHGYEMARTVSVHNKQAAGKLHSWNGSVQEWAGAHWNNQAALIFIGAAGIAVRAIAPFVKDKLTDPAVLVMDELALHVIPILSGHIGGANELAAVVARVMKAETVLTTATDLQHRFAVDVFARQNHLYITDRAAAKEISARILAGEVIRIYCDDSGEVQWGGQQQQFQLRRTTDEEQADIRISPYRGSGGLWLIPPAVVAGTGCRRGVSAKQLETFLEKCLAEHQLDRHSLAAIASIDLKREEPGLQQLSHRWDLPLCTFTAADLAAAEPAGGAFSESVFVREQTGVGNVCERAAVLAGGRRVVMSKRAEDGMTAALMMRDWRIYFA